MPKRTLIILFVIVLLLTVSCWLYLFWPPTLKAEWNTSPEEKIIEVGFIGEVDYNYIPDVQLWGDGHIIWVKRNADSQRQVWEGYLAKDEMTKLVKQLIEAGFFEEHSRFNWDIQEGDFIEVNLSNIGHRVTIELYNGYDNQQVLDLVNFLRNGAGVIGAEFLPESGTLYAYPLEEVEDYPDDAKAGYKWPEDKFGYGLKTVEQNEPNYGRKLTGEELEFAWEIVNSPVPLVESEGKVYWIGVVIPKIGL